jgi:hypothetical protein
MLQRHSITALALALLAFTAAHAGEAAKPPSDLDVPSDKIPGEKPGEMMKQYWQRQAEAAFGDWQAEYEARTKPEAVAAYQKGLRAKQGDGGFEPHPFAVTMAENKPCSGYLSPPPLPYPARQRTPFLRPPKAWRRMQCRFSLPI